MIGKIEFPEGITFELKYITGADFLGEEFSLGIGRYLYQYAKNKVVRIVYDTSKATDISYMFYGCETLVTIPQFDTSNVNSMSYMFYGCMSLVTIPTLDTSNVTTMNSMFYNCKKIITIPQFDTSNVTTMDSMFYNCSLLESIPYLDTSNVTTVGSMFRGCSNLASITDLNLAKVTSFGGSSSSSWLYNSTRLQSMGVIDCDSVTNIGYALGNTTNNNLTHLGGFRNLGKASSVSNTNGSYFMNYAPNLNYQSVLNVLNGLYDRASAGLSVLTLKLHANHLAMLSEDDIAIATNKGWTIV